MIMTVLQAGPMTTVQDRGRFGYLEYGIGQSGVMDQLAYEQANKLVGNKKGEAVLEMTLMGIEFALDEDAIIAYTGAEMQAQIDNFHMERGKAYLVEKGQIVKFGIATKGIRAYLAIAGKMQIEDVLGSKSTNMKCQLGGFGGRKLQNGDKIGYFLRKDSFLKRSRLLHKSILQEDYEGKKKVRVILGPQDNYFDEKAISVFFSTNYKVSSESDRMGIRLLGEKIEARKTTDIISDGIVFGSIQITSAGLPIVMMADHQTTGGYAKIATVIQEDLPILAQARPGDEVSFQRMTIS